MVQQQVHIIPHHHQTHQMQQDEVHHPSSSSFPPPLTMSQHRPHPQMHPPPQQQQQYYTNYPGPAMNHPHQHLYSNGMMMSSGGQSHHQMNSMSMNGFQPHAHPSGPNGPHGEGLSSTHHHPPSHSHPMHNGIPTSSHPSHGVPSSSRPSHHPHSHQDQGSVHHMHHPNSMYLTNGSMGPPPPLPKMDSYNSYSQNHPSSHPHSHPHSNHHSMHPMGTMASSLPGAPVFSLPRSSLSSHALQLHNQQMEQQNHHPNHHMPPTHHPQLHYQGNHHPHHPSYPHHHLPPPVNIMPPNLKCLTQGLPLTLPPTNGLTIHASPVGSLLNKSSNKPSPSGTATSRETESTVFASLDANSTTSSLTFRTKKKKKPSPFIPPAVLPLSQILCHSSPVPQPPPPPPISDRPRPPPPPPENRHVFIQQAQSIPSTPHPYSHQPPPLPMSQAPVMGSGLGIGSTSTSPSPNPSGSSSSLPPLSRPSCTKCTQSIKDEECTEAEGGVYHIGCFSCVNCSVPLGGLQYIMQPITSTSSDQEGTESPQRNHPTPSAKDPYCTECYDTLFGEYCEGCGQLIRIAKGTSITHEGRSWHADEVCFSCYQCSSSLLGLPFLPHSSGFIFCSISCSQEAFAKDTATKRQRRQRDKQLKFDPLTDQLNDNSLSPLLEEDEVDSSKSQPIITQTTVEPPSLEVEDAKPKMSCSSGSDSDSGTQDNSPTANSPPVLKRIPDSPSSQSDSCSPSASPPLSSLSPSGQETQPLEQRMGHLTLKEDEGDYEELDFSCNHPDQQMTHARSAHATDRSNSHSDPSSTSASKNTHSHPDDQTPLDEGKQQKQVSSSLYSFVGSDFLREKREKKREESSRHPMASASSTSCSMASPDGMNGSNQESSPIPSSPPPPPPMSTSCSKLDASPDIPSEGLGPTISPNSGGISHHGLEKIEDEKKENQEKKMDQEERGETNCQKGVEQIRGHNHREQFGKRLQVQVENQVATNMNNPPNGTLCDAASSSTSFPSHSPSGKMDCTPEQVDANNLCPQPNRKETDACSIKGSILKSSLVKRDIPDVTTMDGTVDITPRSKQSPPPSLTPSPSFPPKSSSSGSSIRVPQLITDKMLVQPSTSSSPSSSVGCTISPGSSRTAHSCSGRKQTREDEHHDARMGRVGQDNPAFHPDESDSQEVIPTSTPAVASTSARHESPPPPPPPTNLYHHKGRKDERGNPMNRDDPHADTGAERIPMKEGNLVMEGGPFPPPCRKQGMESSSSAEGEDVRNKKMEIIVSTKAPKTVSFDETMLDPDSNSERRGRLKRRRRESRSEVASTSMAGPSSDVHHRKRSCDPQKERRHRDPQGASRSSSRSRSRRHGHRHRHSHHRHHRSSGYHPSKCHESDDADASDETSLTDEESTCSSCASYSDSYSSSSGSSDSESDGESFNDWMSGKTSITTSGSLGRAASAQLTKGVMGRRSAASLPRAGPSILVVGGEGDLAAPPVAGNSIEDHSFQAQGAAHVPRNMSTTSTRVSASGAFVRGGIGNSSGSSSVGTCSTSRSSRPDIRRQPQQPCVVQ